MANPEPVLDAPRRPIAETKTGVTTRALAPSGFDPKESFFPQAVLEQFDDAPAAAQPMRAGMRFGTREASVALLVLVAVALAAWWGLRSTHAPAPVATQESAPSDVVDAAPIRTAPREPAAAPATPATAARTAPQSHPTAALPVAAATTAPAVAPVTHTRNATHVAPPAAAKEKEEEIAVPTAPPPGCAPAIAALGLCGTANERKGP